MTLEDVDLVLKAIQKRLQTTWFDSDTKNMISSWLQGTSRKELLRIISNESRTD